ncbi:hypothetical protein TrRE_jg5662, partial [Triparma retinervis]
MKGMTYDPDSGETYNDFVQRKRKKNNDYLDSLGLGKSKLSFMQADLNRTKAARCSSSKPRVKPEKGATQPSRRSMRLNVGVGDEAETINEGEDIEAWGVYGEKKQERIKPIILATLKSCSIKRSSSSASSPHEVALTLSAENPAGISDYISNLTIERYVNVTPKKIYSICCA